MQDQVKIQNPVIIKAFTLIEMMVTISLIAILAGLGIASIKMLKPNKDLVDQTTALIIDTFNQVAAESLNMSAAQDVCSIIKGSGSSGASCNFILTDGKWLNINNNLFDTRLTVTFVDQNSKKITKISYIHGLINSVRYLNDAADTMITSSIESSISPVTIKVGVNSTCFNSINLWPNNVTEISESCSP